MQVQTVARITKLVHSRLMAPKSFADLIVDNVKATRARKGLDQADVVERMRALGYTHWYRQTMSRTENRTRRLSADEVYGLALALETNMVVLLSAPSDEAIELPGGKIAGDDITTLASGRNNGAVRWDGNRPVIGPGVNAWWGGPGDDPARGMV